MTRKFSEETKRRMKEAREAKKAALDAVGSQTEEILPETPERIVEEKNVLQKVSDFFSSKKPAKKRNKKKLDTPIIKDIMPVVLAGLISSWITNRTKDPYKAVAPTNVETQAVIQPLFAILSRRLEIYGLVDETTLNLIESGLALAMYAHRAMQVYGEINGQSRATSTPANGNNTSGRDAAFVSDPRQSFSPATTSLPQDEFAGIPAATTATGFTANGRDTAEKVSNLFKRDADGRSRYGLL